MPLGAEWKYEKRASKQDRTKGATAALDPDKVNGLAPLETEADYGAALETLELLWAEEATRPELGTLLAPLSSRTGAYEARLSSMSDVSANRILALLMELERPEPRHRH